MKTDIIKNRHYIAQDIIDLVQHHLDDGKTMSEALRVELDLPDPKARSKKPRPHRWKWPVHMLEPGGFRDFTTTKYNSVSQSAERQAKKYGMEFELCWTIGGVRVTRIR